jgi:hypothetical protein
MNACIFCKTGIIEEFYNVVRLMLPNGEKLRIFGYGPEQNSPRFPRNRIMLNYAKQLWEKELYVFLCVDRHINIAQQLSYDDWMKIRTSMIIEFGFSQIHTIVHTNSMEDWLLSDCKGFEQLLGRKLCERTNMNGAEYIRHLFRLSSLTFDGTGTAFSKGLIKALDIQYIINQYSNDLQPLLSWGNYKL